MNEEQIEVIQSTWAVARPIQTQMADIFYAKLFELDPSLEALFPEDMAEQKAKLMRTLNMLVDALYRFDELVPAVRDLGRRHLSYGVKEEHYRKVGAALLFALEKALGSKWDPEVEEAWTALYSLLAQVMITAARKAQVA